MLRIGRVVAQICHMISPPKSNLSSLMRFSLSSARWLYQWITSLSLSVLRLVALALYYQVKGFVIGPIQWVIL
jgi:hypothetical protein